MMPGSRRGPGTLALRILCVLVALGIQLRVDVGHAEPETAAGQSVESLLAGMAGTRGVVARFDEVKELALLDQPIRSRGVLYFVPPDRMVRITEAPLRTALVVDGARIAFHDGSRNEPVDLSNEPTARQFVENFSVLFGADVERLRERYELTYQPPEESAGSPGASAGWRMQLVPRSVLVRRVISEVVLRGDLRAIREITILESDGDRTVTSVSPIDVDRALTAAELARLFERPLQEGALPGLEAPAGAQE